MKRTNTTLIIALLVFSMAAAATFASAQGSEDPFVRVSWEVVNEETTFENDHENSQWVFGPQPEVWIGYADNLTSIADNNYRVEVDTDLLINITIPKSFIGVDNTIDTVHFWGTTLRPRSPIFVLEYNVTAGDASMLSLYYEPGSQEPALGEFLSLNSGGYDSTTDNYEISFNITFIEDVVEGVFWTGMQAIDVDGKPVSPSWLARLNSGSFATPPIGLGVPVDPQEFSLPSYYYADIVNPDEEVIHYISDNDTFIVQIMASEEVGEVLIPFAILDWADDLKQWVNYSQPFAWPISMFNENPTMVWMNSTHPPVLFLQQNATGTHVVAGYPDISFEWVELDEGIGMWYPNYGITYNSSIDVSKYFVVNDTYTGTFNGDTAVRWGGYFTNNTDMNADPYKVGAVIRPEMALVKVENLDGEPLTPRPEIAAQQTMKLAYKADFIEAFVLDQYGAIADIAMQEDSLNMTLLVNKPSSEVNGSTVIGDEYKFNITNQLETFSIEVGGSGGGSNDTHHWRADVLYNMTLNFTDMTSETWTTFTLRIFERGGGMVSDETTLTNLWTVSNFEIEIEDELTTLNVEFSFNADAPAMVLDSSSITVGFIQNILVLEGSSWVIPAWYIPAIHGDWTDARIIHDLSGDILWSPSHLRLGDPDYWRPPIWTVTDDGAIDLDGNTYTTEDQYFVKRTGYWHDNGTVVTEGMIVGVGLDPSPGEDGDEFVSWSWMGVQEMSLEFDANETFYWYGADDFSSVSPSELEDIQDTVWAEEGIPTPGYEWVAWLSENRTLDLTEITGLEDNTWDTTWFAWGTQQAYMVSINENTQTVAAFRARYAGLLLFNDDPENEAVGAPDFAIEDGQIFTDEVSHVVLIDSVDSMELRRPFGATNDTGSVDIDPETAVEFGISIYDVNVTIYPIQIEHSEGLRGPWAFRESYEGALGLNSTNFDYWITHATIEEMAFDITFDVDMVEYDATDEERWNHAVSFKVDQKFGDWTLNDFDQSALEGRGLAVNFFAVLGTATRTQYQAGDEPITDNNGDSLNASYYEFGADDSPFANVSMGGLPYTWGGDGHSVNYTSGSSTVPLGAFSLFYESESGDTVTDWTVEASMLFMTAGYTQWGGQEIICDPVFVSYTSAHQTPMSIPPTTPIPTGGNLRALVLLGGGLAVVVVILAMIRRRR